jgi:hypothetical protein
MLETRIAKVISYLFHPLLMPTIGALLILNIGGYMVFTVVPQIKYLVLAIIFMFTFLFPSFASYYLLRKGYIQSMNMATIEERRLPLVLTAIFYFFTYYILGNANLPPVLFLMILGATLSVLITLIITLAWKVSAHMVGMGGLTGAIIGLSIKFSINLQILIITLLILSGLVGYARLRLSAHNHSQIYWGFLIGLASMMLLINGVK